MASITLESVTRYAGPDLVLDRIDLEVRDGELLALLGPSGSGKTSIVRAIAGLDPLTSGRVIFGDVDVTELPTRDRDVAMVFQSNALFRTHKARDNIGFPLRIRKMHRQEIEDRVTAESRALKIEEVLDRWPGELSDGHQQLVQIARALVRVPRVFLLDEPLAMLDKPTRIRLRQELRLLQSGYGVTMVYATNDPEDALALAERVAVVDRGRIIQIDQAHAIWRNPINRSTAELTGPIELIDVTIQPDGRGYWLTAPGLRLRAWAPALGDIPGGRAVVGVRSDAIRIDDNGPIAGTLGRLTFSGSRAGRDVHVGPARLASYVGETLTEGTPVAIAFDHWHVFHPSGTTICTVN